MPYHRIWLVYHSLVCRDGSGSKWPPLLKVWEPDHVTLPLLCHINHKELLYMLFLLCLAHIAYACMLYCPSVYTYSAYALLQLPDYMPLPFPHSLWFHNKLQSASIILYLVSLLNQILPYERCCYKQKPQVCSEEALVSTNSKNLPLGIV